MQKDAINTKKTYFIGRGTLRYPHETLSNFLKTEDSPFSDQYDFWMERQLLGGLADETEMTPSDPMFAKWHDYKMHEAELSKHLLDEINSKPGRRGRPWKYIDYDDIHIYTSDDAFFNQIGHLKKREKGQFVIHTTNALRIWHGRSAAGRSKNPYDGFPGASYVITLIRKIIDASVKNNPYADLVLIEIEQRITELQQIYAAKIHEMESLIEETKNKLGISLGEYESTEPLPLEMDFQHAYGHLIVQLVALYDRICRYSQTLRRSALVTSAEGQDELKLLTNKFKALLELVKDRSRKISLVSIATRDLLLVDNNKKADEVIKNVIEALGPVPKEVFTFELKPEYVTLKHVYKIKDEQMQRMLTNAMRLGLVEMEEKEVIGG